MKRNKNDKDFDDGSENAIEYFFLPIAFLYYIVALCMLIIGVFFISIALEKNPIKIFKELHREMLGDNKDK